MGHLPFLIGKEEKLDKSALHQRNGMKTAKFTVIDNQSEIQLQSSLQFLPHFPVLGSRGIVSLAASF